MVRAEKKKSALSLKAPLEKTGFWEIPPLTPPPARLPFTYQPGPSAQSLTARPGEISLRRVLFLPPRWAGFPERLRLSPPEFLA